MDSDPDLEIIEKDSGMSSLGGSKDETPERNAVIEDIVDVEDIEVEEVAGIEDPAEHVEEIKVDHIESANKALSTMQNDEENFEDEPDETFIERLWGLTEMLPESVRTACELATDISINGTKTLYKLTCNASWIFFTSSMILFAPVLLETERAQMAELEKSQKQRVLLGPGAALSGGPEPALPPMAR